MRAKNYSRFAAVIFALIGVLQLARAVTAWEITLNGSAIPVWPSWMAAGVGLALAWLGFAASRS